MIVPLYIVAVICIVALIFLELKLKQIYNFYRYIMDDLEKTFNQQVRSVYNHYVIPQGWPNVDASYRNLFWTMPWNNNFEKMIVRED